MCIRGTCTCVSLHVDGNDTITVIDRTSPSRIRLKCLRCVRKFINLALRSSYIILIAIHETLPRMIYLLRSSKSRRSRRPIDARSTPDRRPIDARSRDAAILDNGISLIPVPACYLEPVNAERWNLRAKFDRESLTVRSSRGSSYACNRCGCNPVELPRN